MVRCWQNDGTEKRDRFFEKDTSLGECVTRVEKNAQIKCKRELNFHLAILVVDVFMGKSTRNMLEHTFRIIWSGLTKRCRKRVEWNEGNANAIEPIMHCCLSTLTSAF